MVPQLRDWHERYGSAGLTIVGVHSPEFPWERPHDRVVAAVRELGIRYPVVQDNDFNVWKRYGIRAWPTTLLIDKQGRVRAKEVGYRDLQVLRSLAQALDAEAAPPAAPPGGGNGGGGSVGPF